MPFFKGFLILKTLSPSFTIYSSSSFFNATRFIFHNPPPPFPLIIWLISLLLNKICLTNFAFLTLKILIFIRRKNPPLAKLQKIGIMFSIYRKEKCLWQKKLLQSKKVTLGLSNSMITDLIGFSDRTRRDYMKCKIINGKYTPKLLELLQISLHDWNNANDTESEE